MNVADLVPSYNRIDRYLPHTLAQIASERGNDEAPIGIRAMMADGIRRAYEAGFQGCFCRSPDAPYWAQQIAAYATDQIRDQMGRNSWLVEQVMPTALQGQGDGKRAINHRYVTEILPYALKGNQDYGNCRAWSMRSCTNTIVGMAAAIGEAVRMAVRHGTALVYAHRGHSGDGMDMATGCRVVTTIGQSEERDYGGGIDLSTESADEAYGARYGSSGPPKALIDACRGDQVQRAWSLGSSPTIDQVKDVLWAEGVIDHGSTMTAAATANGLISSLKRIGGHAQSALMYDDTDEMRKWVRDNCGVDLGTDCVVGSDQSWGDWLSLPRWPTHLWGARPEGMWIVRGQDFIRVLRDWGEGWAMTGAKGFQARSLPDWGYTSFLGQ